MWWAVQIVLESYWARCRSGIWISSSTEFQSLHFAFQQGYTFRHNHGQRTRTAKLLSQLLLSNAHHGYQPSTAEDLSHNVCAKDISCSHVEGSYSSSEYHGSMQGMCCQCYTCICASTSCANWSTVPEWHVTSNKCQFLPDGCFSATCSNRCK